MSPRSVHFHDWVTEVIAEHNGGGLLAGEIGVTDIAIAEQRILDPGEPEPVARIAE